MSEQTRSSSSARRIEALTRHLAVTPLAVSTKEKVMAELAQERACASFPVRKMTHFVDGGEHKTQFREEVMEYLSRYSELRTSPSDYDLTLQQRRVAILTKVRYVFQLIAKHGANMDKRNIMAEIAGIYDLAVWVRYGVHFGLFSGAIGSQGDREQQDEWMTPALRLKIFGSFAMTELGHGSFTRGFETTAVYDHASDEFIIHTPTDTATKWWIGAAGETATHTVCFAQLMIDGESKGVQSFLVPLRDPQTHEPLPGIRIGDIGSKMGLQGVDNGWIQFDHVRVPRFNMLRRYASVTREGKFIQTHKAQMAYAALIGTRGKLVTLSNGILKKALTIAVRYCAIRRQGVQVNSKDAHEETKLLDYQSHQYRLMPLLAQAYAYHFQTSHIEALIEKFDNEGGDIATDLLADIHGTMAGLKAFCSWDTLAGIEECRQCCGGSGYSSYNGLSNLLADFSVIVTFEGDNTVMALQTANYLIRSVEALKNGQKLAGSVQYLERVSGNQTQKRWDVHSAQDLLNPENLIDALTVFAGKQVFAVAAKHAKASAAFPNPQEAWNHCHVDLLEIARVHVFYTIAVQFIHEVQKLKKSSTHADLATPLETLCLLYVLHEFDRSAAFFLKEQYMTAAQCELIHDQVVLACGRVRLDAVPLVDTFNLSDLVLNSRIGKADGNIYEHMLGVAAKKMGISPYFTSHIKPMLEGEQLEGHAFESVQFNEAIETGLVEGRRESTLTIFQVLDLRGGLGILREGGRPHDLTPAFDTLNTGYSQPPINTNTRDHDLQDSSALQVGRHPNAIVTGANSGIGYVTALELARKEAERKIQAELAANEGAGKVEFAKLDMSSLQSAREFATEFLQTHDRLDLLINNAGIAGMSHALTVDGYESQFAANHLGHFALTAQLFDLIKASAPSRIVSLSSLAHRASKLNEDEIMTPKEKYSPMAVYADTKLCNTLFTKELDRRIKVVGVQGVTATVCHPGSTATNLTAAPASENGFFASLPWKMLNSLSFLHQSVERGALPPLYAAVGANVQRGDYFRPRGFLALRGHPALEEPSKLSESKSAATKLWTLSERLANVSFEVEK